MLDWGFAGLVGGIGFGVVFAVLIILAGVIWLVGKIFGKTSTNKSEPRKNEKGN
ncbi:hypothetical protein ES707_13018 [subsurface metagenome]